MISSKVAECRKLLRKSNDVGAMKKGLGFNSTDFEDFIANNLIYVDKTKIIHTLITSVRRKHFYFISGPRRFGKSLLLSTLKALFSGKKELFKDYWIGQQTDFEWHKHPVIHLDFSMGHSTTALLQKNLCLSLEYVAQGYGIQTLQGDDPEGMLTSLVRQLSGSTNAKLILLIDEYDKPLLDHINNPAIAEANRELLNGFYSMVKALEVHWRAIFITGVSRFSRTSLFSGMNNLFELTLDPVVADLFGYTYDELVFYYDEYIDELAAHLGKTRDEMLAVMQEWYNGYRFSYDMEKSLTYNPFSILSCFNKQEINNYWFATGTPSFLISFLRSQGSAILLKNKVKLHVQDLMAFDIADIPLFTLLLQLGYLTIVGYEPTTKILTLDYPNREVRESFQNYLIRVFAYASHTDVMVQSESMRSALFANDFTRFFHAVKTLFAGIPYNLHISKESYYHSLLHLTIDMLGMSPSSEEASSKGRADMVVETKDSIIIFEFKHGASPQEALQQIEEKKYYAKYTNKNKAIVLVGANIDFRDKELFFEWQSQTLN